MNSKAVLLIFIKNPQKGKVKTRLAQTVGDEKALQIYLALLGHTRQIASSLPVDKYLFYSQFIDDHDDWPSAEFNKFLQAGSDLGARMYLAFRQALESHDKAIIIGSDCASLSPEIVEKAFQALDTHDFVIGPAEDGGYYLLGMKKAEISIFSDIAWSTEAVFPTTVERIQLLEKSFALMPTLSDIDYEADWEKYGWELPG